MSTKNVDADKKDWHMGMVSPEQCRAARGWLGWSQRDLAKKANIGLSTLKDFENGHRTPIANNLEAIQRALKGAGIELEYAANGSAIGVRKNGKLDESH